MNDDEKAHVALDLFDELVELPVSERTRFLATRCDDAETRREVESLLAAHDDAGRFFAEPSRAARRHPEPGTRIGHYELLELLGEGGFAQVLRARQHHPVRRDVALKLIKPGMDSRQVLARFELERQALAMMDHPGIAAVYDAGVTEAGQPYFVMELVRGPRITRYCDEASLGVRDRVRLMVDVCHAVHHAHTKGILHRDLKPSNILVTEVDGRAVPKVIDFGVAKATQQRLTELTVMTHDHQVLGTPQYMSPEQAVSGGADVDTRSDVYSLGAVLYELLTGAGPLDEPGDAGRRAGAGAGAGAAAVSALEQLRRLSGDAEAPRPSSRATDEARRRALRGELDWIIGACLAKDRARRYESVAALSADLTAYLESRPVNAAPPTLSYRARTFARRNTAVVVLSGLVLFTLLVGSVVSATQAYRARRAERLAQRRLGEAQSANATLQAVNEFLTKDMIGSADPAVTRGDDLSVRAALDKAAAAIDGRFPGQPLVEAAVRQSIADAYLTLGRADLALPHAQQTLAERRRVLGADDLQTIIAMNQCAVALHHLGRDEESYELSVEALRAARRTLDPNHRVALSALDHAATAALAMGRWSEAEPLARQAWERSRDALGADDDKALVWQNNYARALQMLSRPREAEPLFRDVWERRTRRFGEDYPGALTALNNYALVLKQQGRLTEAEPLYQRALELRRRVMGEDHPDTLASLHNYAGLLGALGRYADAQPLIEEHLERRRRTQGQDHPHTLLAMSACAENLRALGRFDEALALQRETLDRRRRTLGEDHPDTLVSLNNYAVGLQAAGRVAESEPLHREALDRRTRVLGESHRHTLASLNNYARVLAALDRPADAEPHARRALDGFREVYGRDHPETLTIQNNYAVLLVALDRPQEAEPLLAELHAAVPKSALPPARAAVFVADYGLVLAQLHKDAAAEPVLRNAHERFKETAQTKHPKFREVIESLAEVCERTAQTAEAARWRGELDLMKP